MVCISVKKTLALISLFSLLLVLTAFRTISGWIHPLEPISKHYKTLAALSPEPNPARAWMDTIQFPWAEYSTGALSTSLMRPYYLSPEDEAKLPGLVRFPANSSNQTRAELDYLLDLQNKRTQKEIERAEYIANFGSSPNIINPLDSEFNENRKELFYIATPVIGDWYNYQNFPATTQLLMNCIQDIRVTEFRLKRFFKRARPYHLEPRLLPLARMTSPSFASGHSLWSFTEAYIFSEIIPVKRDEFLKMAEEVRWSRELMGIHYPSDNEASRVIGWHLLQGWYHNPQFVTDLEKARIEWANKKKMQGL
ncbi:MAG TPA: phosphatase PAP2 family protein [Puia sp.]|nr:phosphatase PAP2 family protein [Puia sp.]